MFKSRRNYLIQKIKECQMDAVIIDSPSNLYYYTGFTGGEAFFVMPVTGRSVGLSEQGDTISLSGREVKEEGYLITDSRYYEQAAKECPELILLRLEEKGYSETVKELFDHIRTVTDSEHTKEAQLQSGHNLRAKIMLEDSMKLSVYLKLCKVCREYQFYVHSDVINECRMVKDAEEIGKIRKAEAIGDAAFTHILGLLKPGISEADIALELEFFMKRQGASKLSFDTITAGGPNSSMPHARVTNRKIGNGEFVTMDFGCVYQGYCSDMTRTVAVGEPTDEMKKVYQIVLDANQRAMEGIRAGRRCDEIDALARGYIREQGYGEYFGHGLGHGVGLDIHEEPRFSPKCRTVAKENMVITDEPGIYLPGRFGVRIEDLTVVKNDGCECLSRSERKLIIL